MDTLLNALFHGIVYALVGGIMLVIALFILDALTPGRLGTHLHGDTKMHGDVGPVATPVEASKSAGIVVSAWLLGTAAILFTAIWTNGETSLGVALAWTVAFGLVGIALNTVMLLVMDLVTPGNLRSIVCTPGSAVPLAYMTAAASLAISLIVCASIA